MSKRYSIAYRSAALRDLDDHRVIYEISDTEVTVTVAKIGNRRDVYRGW